MIINRENNVRRKRSKSNIVNTTTTTKLNDKKLIMTNRHSDKLIIDRNERDRSILTEMFMCPNCTKCYQLKHSLTRHIKFECGKEPSYQCHRCNRKFKHKYDLNVHVKAKHGESNVTRGIFINNNIKRDDDDIVNDMFKHEI